MTLPAVSGLGRLRARLVLSYGFAVFALSGAVVWAALGALLAWMLPIAWALTLGLVGCLLYGGAQLFSRGAARVPERVWQVPAQWLHGRTTWGRLVIWGTTLGPGLMTRNPYASFWVVVPALAALDRPVTAALVGACAGAAHGVARFGGIVIRQRTGGDADWQLVAVLWHLRFQRLDGVLLTVLGTALAVAFVSDG